MRLGIMQPYFFPYLGHFALIANVDKWVVFDITQYTPKTWISRNRVLHPIAGSNWVSIPLKNSSISIKIHEARLLDPTAAMKSTLGKISHYRGKAPFARQVEKIVETAFAVRNGDSLVSVNVAGLDAVCAYLEVPFRRTICSTMNLPLPEHMEPGAWAPEIARLVGAAIYLNPIGGQAIFKVEDFERRGVKLEFLRTEVFIYETGPLEFVPNLSILDVLMWNTPQAVRKALKAVATIVEVVSPQDPLRALRS